MLDKYSEVIFGFFHLTRFRAETFNRSTPREQWLRVLLGVVMQSSKVLLTNNA